MLFFKEGCRVVLWWLTVLVGAWMAFGGFVGNGGVC